MATTAIGATTTNCPIVSTKGGPVQGHLLPNGKNCYWRHDDPNPPLGYGGDRCWRIPSRSRPGTSQWWKRAQLRRLILVSFNWPAPSRPAQEWRRADICRG